jgi:hypothetical protein
MAAEPFLSDHRHIFFKTVGQGKEEVKYMNLQIISCSFYREKFWVKFHGFSCLFGEHCDGS